ncbi:MAG: PE-PPE domain-containing protein [Mycobacterium sp.]|nr:MAG: PE-PPE domain-containing protein [Mycobacterium sp.]
MSGPGWGGASLLTVTPEALASAASDLETIRAALGSANAAAAGPTVSVISAAADEVSAAIAQFFADYGLEFQALSERVSAAQQNLVRLLNAASNSYLGAEAISASTMQTTLSGPLGGGVSTLIMGGTGNPTPNATYLNSIYNAYIAPLIAPQSAIPTGLTTPEQGFPLTGLNSLTYDTSVAQGFQILKQAISAQPPGTHTVVFGFSQSATIITEYLKGIANGSIIGPPPSDLSFILAGNPNNPNGGLFQRFVGLYLPGVNETFSGATPDSAYATSIYTIQYDGFAHFPRYPLNLLADANALAGMYYGHLSPTPAYENLTAAQIASAIVAPVSPGAPGNTTYYMIPSQDLPLLRPLNLPQPVLNLIQPPLRVLIDMGYGDIGGANTEFANLPTPASLFPVINPVNVGSYLIKGTVQGVQANLVWAGVLPQSYLPDTYPYVASLDPGLTINLGQPGVTAVSAVTTGLGSLLRALNIPPLTA